MSQKESLDANWFRIAVQALVVVARSEGACPSGAIAQDLEAHAVFLRRVLAQLVRAGIAEAREGRSGGYRLARSPDDISLADVHMAVRLAEPTEEALPRYDTGTGVQAALDEVKAEVDRQIVALLAQYSLAALMARAGELKPP